MQSAPDGGRLHFLFNYNAIDLSRCGVRIYGKPG